MSRCACPADGSFLCARCAGILSRHETAVNQGMDRLAGTLGAGLTERRGGEAAEPEAQLLSKVLTLAKQYGWLGYHTHDSRKSPEGFPDIVLCREVVLFAELKSKTGKPSMAQLAWLESLRRTGQVEVYLWRSRDWPDIEARLTKKVSLS